MNKLAGTLQKVTVILLMALLFGACTDPKGNAQRIPDPKEIDKKFEYGNYYPDYRDLYADVYKRQRSC